MSKEGLRFDMHAAFRPESEKTLKEWTELNKNALIQKYDVYRPRFGVFAQSEKCAAENESAESVIPTFTCNFFAKGFEKADQIMDQVMSSMFSCKQHGEYLKKNFLRVRSEGQYSLLKYDTETRKIQETREQSENEQKYFPSKVENDEYYDAHIHLSGITCKNMYTNVAYKASKHRMPIIVNINKDASKQKPFLTVRWYNTTLESAIESLENIYNDLYLTLLKDRVKMKIAPEFEVTMNDPDCQKTDRGWMPIPSNCFEITHDHCMAPEKFLK